jgi:predicted Zn-dependent protease with MMP-like domain
MSEHLEVTPEFEALVAQGVEALPGWVRAKLDNVVFVAEYAPSDEVKQAEGLLNDDELFGYYHGIPLTERGEFYGVGMALPDTITIFEYAHRAHAGEDAAKLGQMVTETVWHEVGHYLGLDEEAVRIREHERGHIPLDEQSADEHTDEPPSPHS